MAGSEQGVLSSLEIRDGLEVAYADVLTPEAMAALRELAPFDADRKAAMSDRMARRSAPARLRNAEAGF